MRDYTEEIRRWCQDYAHRDTCLLVEKLRAEFFNDEAVVSILEIINSTCSQCWDGDSSCQCWNDE